MITIKDVSFRYTKEQEAICDINLEIKAGECVLLCGESGCGKTTVTKLVNGLIPHFEDGGILTGQVTVAGFSVALGELYRLAEHIGSVFQNPKSQFFNLDSDSELVFGLENAGTPPDIIRQRLDVTVRELHIGHLLGKNIFTLSGGEKQSLAFGSVYAMNPDIFVLDEPTANLDADAIEILRQQIMQVKSEGRIVLVAEHRLYFLADIIDRAVFLKNGRIAGHFTRDEFLALSEDRRAEMGLRTLSPTRLSLPTAQLAGQEYGLSVEGLYCALDRQTVFRDITFSAGYGEVLGIIGNNGSGKSTLTRCLCGLIKQSAGQIKLDGKVLSHKTRTKLSFFVMQDVNHQLFSDSVWNECEMSAPDCEPKRIESVLEAFDLLSLKDRHPMALSGGQKQRLAVATAVLSDRKMLIFDEPTSGLDYRHMLEVADFIRSLAGESKVVLIISHDFEFLARACDRIHNIDNHHRMMSVDESEILENAGGRRRYDA
jgi:energy-coupling factor transport system ATP-binding protein